MGSRRSKPVEQEAWLPALTVAAVAVAASAAGVGNDFAMDDVHLLLDDSRFHSLSAATAFFREPYWPAPFNRDLYRPLSALWFALQWSVGGGSPVVFRVVSYALYALVSVGVLVLGRRVLPGAAGLAVALLFAAHPVHVEAVALGVNQSELWVGLIAVACTVRYLDVRRRGWPSTRDWMVIAPLFALATLVKEHALAIPGLLLAAELALLDGESARERVRRLWPGFVTLAAIGAVFLAARSAVLGSFIGSFTAPALVGQGISGRALTMLQVVPEWLRLLLFPLRLQGDYSPAEIEQATRWGVAQTAGLVLLIALATLGWRLRKAAPAVSFGLLWAGAAMLPVANLLVPTGIVMAERTLFLPSVGLLIAAGGVVSSAAASRRTRRVPPPSPARAPDSHAPMDGHTRVPRLATAAVAVLVLAGIARSALRHADWRDHVHFWRRTALDAPLSHKAHYAYGQLLYQSGEEERGLREYHMAVALAPREAWLLRELGDLYQRRGECGAALYWYGESLAVDPDQGTVLLSRISCLMQLGRMEEAMREAATAGAGVGPP